MRISDFFYAPVLCLLWLPEHAADPVQLSAPKEVTAALGGSLSVSCRYNHKYRDHTKYWCKGKIYELCSIVVKTPRNRRSDATFIADHKQERLFTVTMTSLGQRDEGKYWCVIATPGKNVRTGVTVRISHAVTASSTSTSTILLTPASVARDEICWWAFLRWILFILMLCSLILTHIFSWRNNFEDSINGTITKSNL